MTVNISEEWMKKQIAFSNNQAAKNRNYYPLQEQATQMDLWEYVPCTCDDSCTCRKHGCTHHWKLKKGLHFEEFRDGLLRMFVDKNHHRPVIEALNGKDPSGLSTRAIGAYHVLRKLRESWPEIADEASEHNKTLFCDDWVPASYRERMSFPVEGTSIYLAKQYCVLFPDIAIPYDTTSRPKMLRFLDSQGIDYIEFLTKARGVFLAAMERNKISMPVLRRLDNPQEQLPFNPHLISLSRSGTNYGSTYKPAQRTISIVLDKCFYQPKVVNTPPSGSEEKNPGWGKNSALPYTTQPLSGKGQPIMVHLDPPCRLVLWGTLTFELTNEMVRTILEKFFINPNRWYLLGASMTSPDPAGLGSFVRATFPSFSPRHASAIAAILVHEGYVTYRGSKPIELKKTAGRFEMERLARLEEND